jgi:hypothetical protein
VWFIVVLWLKPWYKVGEHTFSNVRCGAWCICWFNSTGYWLLVLIVQYALKVKIIIHISGIKCVNGLILAMNGCFLAMNVFREGLKH